MDNKADSGFDWSAFENLGESDSPTEHQIQDTPHCHLEDVWDMGRYHIGFFVRSLIYTHWKSIALYFDDCDQCFKYCYYDGKPECSLYDTYNPVLIKNVSNTKAESILPLRDKPIVKSYSELSDEGIQTVFERGSHGECVASLYNGKEQIRLPKQDSTLLLIYALDSFKKSDEQVTSRTHFSLYKDNLEKEIKKIETRVLQYDLSEILKELHISVRESFVCRPGKDDFYYVYKTVTIGYPEEELDNYLKDYIGLGERCIHKDSGYTSAYNMAIKGLITGDYNDDNVNKEREKLLSEYSPQKHIYHNLFDHISSRLYPQGLKYPDHLSNKISLERNSLMPLFWRLLRGKKYSEYFDKLDKTCSWKGFTDSTLSEINEDLSNYSALTKVFRDIECWEKDPQYSII